MRAALLNTRRHHESLQIPKGRIMKVLLSTCETSRIQEYCRGGGGSKRAVVSDTWKLWGTSEKPKGTLGEPWVALEEPSRNLQGTLEKLCEGGKGNNRVINRATGWLCESLSLSLSHSLPSFLLSVGGILGGPRPVIDMMYKSSGTNAHTLIVCLSAPSALAVIISRQYLCSRSTFSVQ